MSTQATRLSDADLNRTLAHLEQVMDTGRRLRGMRQGLKALDERSVRVRTLLTAEVQRLEAEFQELTQLGEYTVAGGAS